jgi:hypothetical protein
MAACPKGAGNGSHYARNGWIWAVGLDKFA